MRSDMELKMHTDEDRAFISILRDHLLQRKSYINPTFNWNEILRLSCSHEVTGIVHRQCKGLIPADKVSEFERAYVTALFYYSNRVKAMQHVSTILTEAGIPFFPVKGLEVAKYYPLPSLRTMGDSDVVVEPGRLEETMSILRAHDFRDASDSGPHVWSCNYKKLHFEFHDRLIEMDTKAPEQIEFFDNFMPYVKDNTLDWDFHFLFLIMHLRKHFMNSGVGIRQFMDIAVVAEGRENLNWPWIEDKLSELKLQRFAHACYSLIEDWFGIKMPVQYEKLDRDLTAEVTNKVLSDGVFGFEDESNKDNRVGNILIQSEGSFRKNRALFFVCRLFPDYKEMTEYPGCGFLIGKPYLLPVAWIRRLIYILKDKDNTVRKHTITGALKSTSELEKRRAFLEKLGLLDS